MVTNDKTPPPIPESVQNRVKQEALPELKEALKKKQSTEQNRLSGIAAAEGDGRKVMKSKQLPENQQHTVTPGAQAKSTRSLVDRFAAKPKSPTTPDKGKGRGR